MGYYAGDFYAGMRGDPGFLGSLFNLGKSALGLVPGVGPIASTALSKVGRFGRAATAGREVLAKAGGVITKHPVLTAAGAAGAGVLATAGAEHLLSAGGACHVRPGHRPLRKGGMVLKSGKIGKCYRRMNVCNPHALRRSLRRAHGFAKFAMRAIRLTHPHKKGRFGGFKTRARKGK